MPSPSTSLATLRPDLAGSLMQFDLDSNAAGAIATMVLPVLDVAKASGTFGKITIDQLLMERETARAPGSGYARSRFTFTTDSYACEEHGAEEPVDDREARMYADYFDAEQVSAARARSSVLINLETRVKDLIFNTSTWTGASLTTAITNEWDDYTNATPRNDVEAAIQKVADGSGQIADTLILGWKPYRNLRLCAQIIDLIKYAGFDDPKIVGTEVIAQVLGIKRILVGGMFTNSANEGAAASLASVWGTEYAMVCKTAQTSDIREPCVGRIFHYSEDGSSIGGTMESYREEQSRSDIVRCRMDTDEKVLYAQCGHLLSNVTT